MLEIHFITAVSFPSPKAGNSASHSGTTGEATLESSAERNHMPPEMFSAGKITTAGAFHLELPITCPGARWREQGIDSCSYQVRRFINPLQPSSIQPALERIGVRPHLWNETLVEVQNAFMPCLRIAHKQSSSPHQRPAAQYCQSRQPVQVQFRVLRLGRQSEVGKAVDKPDHQVGRLRHRGGHNRKDHRAMTAPLWTGEGEPP